MRLIDVTSMKLVEFLDESRTPQYGILSHRWGSKELSFQEYQTSSVKSHPGYQKIANFCHKVSDSGLQYAWVDTCCIDKTSSAELSESINSMFDWYRKADMCFIYLGDVLVDIPCDDRSTQSMVVKPPSISPAFEWHRRDLVDSAMVALINSAWFTRGWTLQELLAPRTARFYDADWRFFGSKWELKDMISKVTGIEEQYLFGHDIETASIAKRMSWASQRETTRIEDMAYCLLGIFGVNMPLLYGEGKKAFTRLQEEIMKQSSDQSLFAWTLSQRHADGLAGPFASSPAEFADAGSISPYPNIENPPYAMTNQGLRIDIPLHPHPYTPGLWLAMLSCYKGQAERPLAIAVRPAYVRNKRSTLSSQYDRSVLEVEPIVVAPETWGQAEMKTIYLKKSSVARAHDKTYTLQLHLAKSTSPSCLSFKSKAKLLSTYPNCSVLSEKDGLAEWRAAFATDVPRVGIMILLNNVRYLLCIKVIHPETYIHELDWWLRSKCKCRLVGGYVGRQALITDPQRQDLAKKHLEQLDNGRELWDARSSCADFRLSVKLHKDFGNGGVVLGVDLSFVQHHELEGPSGLIELPCFPEPQKSLGGVADEPLEEPSEVHGVYNEWPVSREADDRGQWAAYFFYSRTTIQAPPKGDRSFARWY